MERIVVEGSSHDIKNLKSYIAPMLAISISETHKPMSDEDMENKWEEGYHDGVEGKYRWHEDKQRWILIYKG